MRESVVADVIIVGAGILGASLAYHLVGRGVRDVVVLESRSVGGGSTCKSAAIVRMHYTNPATVTLALRSRELFLDWAGQIGASDAQQVYWRCGWFFLTPADQQENVLANLAMNRQLGVDASLVDHEFLCRQVPGIETDGLGLIVHEPDSGYADPVGVCQGLAQRAADGGAVIHGGVSVDALLTDGDRVTGVCAGGQTYQAPITVVAAGAWTGKLTGDIGLDLAMDITREQELILDPVEPDFAPTVAISNMADRFYLRPRPQGGLLVGRGYPKQYERVEPDNYKLDHDADFADDILTRLVRRFPGLKDSKVRSGVVGLYTVTGDWHPILGPVASRPGLWLATGGSGHAFKIGPAIGQMLAELIVDGRCDWIEADRFNLARFETGRIFESSYGANRA